MWTTDKEMNMKAIFKVTNTTLAVVKKKTWKKFRFCTGLEPITLQYRSSILLTELTNQLGADHNQFYYILITVGYLVKPDVRKHIVLHNGRKSRKTDTTNNIYDKNHSLFLFVLSGEYKQSQQQDQSAAIKFEQLFALL